VRILLDTHAFLWWIADDDRLPEFTRSVIGREDAFVSVATVWEISIKWAEQRLDIDSPIDEFLSEHLSSSGFRALPISLGHAFRAATLPDLHRDPFDRMLVAQAIEDRMVLVTDDGILRQYPVDVLW
jgi:PIN domain nuclease of toxin-antitoxin system